MASSGILRRVALVTTEVSEELSASFIRVTRIGELGTLAVTSNRRMLRRTFIYEDGDYERNRELEIHKIRAMTSLLAQIENIKTNKLRGP
jgi:hypothetical protein